MKSARQSRVGPGSLPWRHKGAPRSDHSVIDDLYVPCFPPAPDDFCIIRSAKASVTPVEVTVFIFIVETPVPSIVRLRFTNIDRDPLLLKRCFSHYQVDLDLGRVQESVMNQAMMHGSHRSFRLLFSQRPRAR